MNTAGMDRHNYTERSKTEHAEHRTRGCQKQQEQTMTRLMARHWDWEETETGDEITTRLGRGVRDTGSERETQRARDMMGWEERTWKHGKDGGDMG